MKIKQGQSIVEIVIAAALISVAIIAALSLSSYSQKQTNTAKNIDLANRYNYQVSDWLREQRNALGWETLVSIATRDDISNHAKYCLDDIPHSPQNFINLTSGACDIDQYIPGTIFIRQLDIDTTSQATGTLKLTITTTWQEKTAHTITSELKLLQ